MFEIHSNKSPGPDGYGSGFFKATWEIIGRDVTGSVLDFFTDRKLVKWINSTIIALIPENESPKNAAEYRPISCCNAIYKCISKMLCARLKSVLSEIVDKNQGAFILRRSIMHNVLLTQDLIRADKNSVRTLVKAFDEFSKTSGKTFGSLKSRQIPDGTGRNS
ncbi:hypothetical protein L6164_002105 [Bauhinia variegata]|uniref:Uncharacterized protein n=1 Tax=Bauhinia variegata TaxID=167791 RepID=A0ACB9PZ10_BAUVA|nr:hypothetical protein L6164_002105 [Bauhinia variegata]